MIGTPPSRTANERTGSGKDHQWINHQLTVKRSGYNRLKAWVSLSITTSRTTGLLVPPDPVSYYKVQKKESGGLTYSVQRLPYEIFLQGKKSKI